MNGVIDKVRKNPRPRASAAAFTLIELLVVITVIALLIGLLLPTLGGARQRARTLQCTTNLRSIGQGLQMYADDNRQSHPYTSDWQQWEGDGAAPDEPGPGWTELLFPYIATRVVFLDKSRQDAPFAYFLQARYPIALVRATGAPPALGRTLSVHLPTIAYFSQFVLAGDCMNRSFFSLPYGPSSRPPNCDLDDGEFDCAFPADRLDPHQGVVNLLFADDHVAGAKQYEPGTMTWHGREMRDWAQTY